MASINLTKRDIDYLARVVATEADPRVAKKSKDQYEKMQKAVVDTILNRVASPSFPNTVEGVVNQRRQFSKIAGPKSEDPHGSVQNAPEAPKAVYDFVADHVKARAAGEPSIIGGNLHYANPNFSDAKNRVWIDKLDAGTFGANEKIHVHGTTDGFKPVGEFEIALDGVPATTQMADLPTNIQPNPRGLFSVTPAYADDAALPKPSLRNYEDMIGDIIRANPESEAPTEPKPFTESLMNNYAPMSNPGASTPFSSLLNIDAQAAPMSNRSGLLQTASAQGSEPRDFEYGIGRVGSSLDNAARRRQEAQAPAQSSSDAPFIVEYDQPFRSPQNNDAGRTYRNNIGTGFLTPAPEPTSSTGLISPAQASPAPVMSTPAPAPTQAPQQQAWPSFESQIPGAAAAMAMPEQGPAFAVTNDDGSINTESMTPEELAAYQEMQVAPIKAVDPTTLLPQVPNMAPLPPLPIREVAPTPEVYTPPPAPPTPSGNDVWNGQADYGVAQGGYELQRQADGTVHRYSPQYDRTDIIDDFGSFKGSYKGKIQGPVGSGEIKAQGFSNPFGKASTQRGAMVRGGLGSLAGGAAGGLLGPVGSIVGSLLGRNIAQGQGLFNLRGAASKMTPGHSSGQTSYLGTGPAGLPIYGNPTGNPNEFPDAPINRNPTPSSSGMSQSEVDAQIARQKAISPRAHRAVQLNQGGLF